MSMSPRLLRPRDTFTPRSISGLALWLDASDSGSTYTTDAGPVSAVASPLDIAGCVGWWDSSDLSAMRQNSDGTGVVAAGDPVGWWLDKSATGATVTGSGAARPTLSATGFNSRQALVFNGSSTNLSNALYTATNNLSGMTRIAVCANTTNTLAMLSRVFSGGSDSFMQMNGAVRCFVSSAANLFVVNLSSGSNIVPAGLYGEVFANSAISFYSSGAGLTGTVSGTIPATTGGGTPAIHIGSNIGVNFFWNGPIAEYIIFNRALTRAELASVEAYLAQRWGISGVHAPATASSDPVGYWADKSGNGRHLTQAISGSRPSFLPTGISSKPCLNFDGTDDNIWRQPGLTSDDLSILLVHQSNTLSGGVTYEFSHQGDTTNAQAQNSTGFINAAGLQVSVTGVPAYMCDVQRSFANVDLQGRSGTAGDITANVPVIGTHCVSYSATASAIRKQAWTSGKGMLNSDRFNCGGWSAITLGARRNSLAAGGINSPSVFLNGRIAEVIAYSRYISDIERRRLELYLARKYNVTLAGAPIVSNPDAQDWIDRVYGNTGSVSSETAAAVNQFCNDIDNASLRDRFFRLNLFCGTGLNAALVPLYLGPTSRGIRYGGTTDTNTGGLFVTANFSESGGLVGDGSTKYLKTGLASNQLAGGLTGHAAIWRGTGTVATTRIALGGSDNDVDDFEIQERAASTHGAWGKTTFVGSSPANVSGLKMVNRSSSTRVDLYSNGSSIANSTASVVVAPHANEFYVFGGNRNGTLTLPVAFPVFAYSLGVSMDATQATNYYNALAAFQTSMSRT